MAVCIFRRTVEPFAGLDAPAINFGHPLAQHLIAAFLFGRTASSGSADKYITRDLVRGIDRFETFTTGTNTQGVKASGRVSGDLLWQGLNQTASPYLRRTVPVSQFWYGTFQANIVGSGAAYVCGVSYHNDGTSPFDAYIISRPSGNNTDINFSGNNAGVSTGVTASGIIASTDYNARPMSLAATYSSGGIYGYQNGRQVATTTGWTAINYGASPLYGVGCTPRNAFTPTTGVATSLWLIFATALTPTDHWMLALNPFDLFIARSRYASLLIDTGIAPFNALNIAP